MWQLSKSLAALAAFMSTNHALVWSGIHLCYNKSFRATFQCETHVLRNQNMENCHNTCLNMWNLNKVNIKVGHLATLSPSYSPASWVSRVLSPLLFQFLSERGSTLWNFIAIVTERRIFLKGNLTIDMSNFTEIQIPTQFISYRHRHVYKRHVHSLIL